MAERARLRAPDVLLAPLQDGQWYDLHNVASLHCAVCKRYKSRLKSLTWVTGCFSQKGQQCAGSCWERGAQSLVVTKEARVCESTWRVSCAVFTYNVRPYCTSVRPDSHLAWPLSDLRKIFIIGSTIGLEIGWLALKQPGNCKLGHKIYVHVPYSCTLSNWLCIIEGDVFHKQWLRCCDDHQLLKASTCTCTSQQRL